MAIEYVLDTHPFLWAVQADKRLSSAVQVLFKDPTIRFVLLAIALAEATWIVALKRTAIPDAQSLMRAIDVDTRVRVVSLDRQTVERAASLQAIHEMHDRQIVATALVLADTGADVRLITRDADITASGLVKVVW